MAGLYHSTDQKVGGWRTEGQPRYALRIVFVGNAGGGRGRAAGCRATHRTRPADPQFLLRPGACHGRACGKNQERFPWVVWSAADDTWDLLLCLVLQGEPRSPGL